MVVSPDGDHAYATSYAGKRVVRFDRDSNTGLLTYVGAYVDEAEGGDSLDGLQGIAISADGVHVYVSAYNDDALSIFHRDSNTGELSFAVRYRENMDGVTNFSSPYGIAISPDQDNVYVASTASDAITAFDRDPMVDGLAFSEVYLDGEMGAQLAGVNDLAISPDGENLYAVSWGWSVMSVFARND
jgi:DNA-binding beta-propeller fold protein YncE